MLRGKGGKGKPGVEGIHDLLDGQKGESNPVPLVCCRV